MLSKHVSISLINELFSIYGYVFIYVYMYMHLFLLLSFKHLLMFGFVRL